MICISSQGNTKQFKLKDNLCIDWIRMSFSHSILPLHQMHVETISKMIIFGGRAFGKLLDHESRTLMNGINGLIREIREIPSFFCHIKTQQEDSHLWTRMPFLTRILICQSPDHETSQPPELWVINKVLFINYVGCSSLI